MDRVKSIICVMLVVTLAGLGVLTPAQQRPNRVSDRQAEATLKRLEDDADRYRESLDEALDRSRLDGSRIEDDINNYVKAFEEATDRLRQRFNNRRSVSADVETVLDRAAAIDNFMRSNRLTPRAQRDWRLVRTDLNQLARAYNVSLRRNYPTTNPPVNNGNYPTNPPVNSSSGNGGFNSDARLTGTYRRDPRRSDDPREIADRATRSLPSSERQRIYDAVVARLESPEMLAIERRGRSVTIVSSRGAQTNFEADGVERSEQLPNGTTVRARARFSGDQLIVSSEGFRENDFSVTFEPLDNGRYLRVTRSIFSERLEPPVIVRSLYDRTSESAQFNIYNEAPRSTTTTDFPRTTADGFIVPNGTTIVAVLENNLSTSQAQEGERFTMRVREPGQFDGAVLEGHVSNVSRAGRISGRSGLTLNFDRIQMRDGRSYKFAGVVENVRTAGGESVRVDNEGSVEDRSSQTDRTVARTAIGTAVGAIIGAIAGGGKGAAIGAAIGAGAGAGSVYVQGRDDLELTNGTELTIRASAPRV